MGSGCVKDPGIDWWLNSIWPDGISKIQKTIYRLEVVSVRIKN